MSGLVCISLTLILCDYLNGVLEEKGVREGVRRIHARGGLNSKEGAPTISVTWLTVVDKDQQLVNGSLGNCVVLYVRGIRGGERENRVKGLLYIHVQCSSHSYTILVTNL